MAGQPPALFDRERKARCAMASALDLANCTTEPLRRAHYLAQARTWEARLPDRVSQKLVLPAA